MHLQARFTRNFVSQSSYFITKTVNFSVFDDAQGPSFDKHGTRFKRLIIWTRVDTRISKRDRLLVLCCGKVYFELYRKASQEEAKT